MAKFVEIAEMEQKKTNVKPNVIDRMQSDLLSIT